MASGTLSPLQPDPNTAPLQPWPFHKGREQVPAPPLCRAGEESTPAHDRTRAFFPGCPLGATLPWPWEGRAAGEMNQRRILPSSNSFLFVLL